MIPFVGIMPTDGARAQNRASTFCHAEREEESQKQAQACTAPSPEEIAEFPKSQLWVALTTAVGECGALLLPLSTPETHPHSTHTQQLISQHTASSPDKAIDRPRRASGRQTLSLNEKQQHTGTRKIVFKSEVSFPKASFYGFSSLVFFFSN